MAMGVVQTSDPLSVPSSSVCGSESYAGTSVEQIAALPTAALVARFRRGVENLDRRMFWLKDAQLDTAFLPSANVGRWPVRVLLGHLADAEMSFAHRMRRTIAEDHPVLAVWDENAFIDAGLYTAGVATPIGAAGSVAGFVAVVHTLRQFTAQWLANITEDQLARRAMHPEKGEITVRDMLVYSTWHLEHHARFLRAKLDKMLGPDIRPKGSPAPVSPSQQAAPSSQASGSCGPGCGCGR